MEYLSNCASQTKKIAARVLINLKDINLLCLYGELGSGKTTFVQGLAKALGIQKRILSPTFIILRQYKLKKGNFYHLDCYRVESEKDFKSIDLPEIWSDPKNLVVIEWADRIQKILPRSRIDIKFEYVARNKRKITVGKD